MEQPPILDREARSELAAAIEDYLQETITAFQFDKRITDISFATKDETVERIRKQLWFHYDDCKDHKVVLSREQWNFYQRLLLLLRSDAHMRLIRNRVWSWRQLVAACMLACFGLVALRWGWGEHLIVFAIPFGAVSIGLSKVKTHSRVAAELDTWVRLAPFASLAQVFAVRRSVQDFRKQAYPPHLAERAIRGPLMSKVIHVPAYLMWMMFSPVVLVFQMFPDRDGRCDVVLPEESERNSLVPAHE